MSNLRVMSEEPNPIGLVPISRAAQLLGVSIYTMRRWDESGQLPAVRLPSGHRRYRLADIEGLTDGKATA